MKYYTIKDNQGWISEFMATSLEYVEEKAKRLILETDWFNSTIEIISMDTKTKKIETIATIK